MSKFYGVQRIVDNKTGKTLYEPKVYTTWAECEKVVKGRHATFKSFSSEDEAWTFAMADEDVDKSVKSNKAMVAYVDGSSSQKTKDLGVGVVYEVAGDSTKHEVCFYGDDSLIIEYANAASEVYSAVFAIEKARVLGLDELHIFHDHQGLASWAKGLWNCNNILTKAYKHYYDNVVEDGMRVVFHKVKGHTGNTFNEIADKLATKGRKEKTNQGNIENDILEALNLKNTQFPYEIGDNVLIRNNNGVFDRVGKILEIIDGNRAYVHVQDDLLFGFNEENKLLYKFDLKLDTKNIIGKKPIEGISLFDMFDE